MAALEEARLSPATTDRYEWRSRLRHIVFGAKTMHLLKVRMKRSDGRAKRCDAAMERTPPYSPYFRFSMFSPDPARLRLSIPCPVTRDTVTRVIVTACRKAGRACMRLHDLRHHSATALPKSTGSVARSRIDTAGAPMRWSTGTAICSKLRAPPRPGRWRT
jgi:integrase